jgi:hypothetical protein
MSDSPADPTSDPTADPELAALLEFEPVPRKRSVEGGWTPELQREFIVRLAEHGSPGRVCDEMGKNLTGLMKLYRSPLAASFRASWDATIALWRRRQAEKAPLNFVSPGTVPPSIDGRRKAPAAVVVEGPLPGQVMNERGEWEDEGSLQRRAEEARDSISRKLLYARRLYLNEISGSAGKRAAFEILTRLPIDWKRARQFKAQRDEPWRKPVMRSPDMLLTAENGWMGELAHGPDKKAELRAAMDAYRAKKGLEPVDWEDGEDD